jgi:hypothetical protein
MASGTGVEAVRHRLNYWSFSARISNDFLKGGNSGRPIRFARRSIPFAAFGLKKYCRGTSPVSIAPDNVDSLARLGDSEVPAVKSSPSNSIPEFGQRPENDFEISSLVRVEQTWHVFDNKNSGATFSNQSSKLMKESRFLAFEPVSLSHSRKRQVLAWEASSPNIGNRNSFNGHLSDVC